MSNKRESMNKIKVLCVDDEPNVLNGLRRQLHFEFDVFTALNGDHGLQVFKEQGPFPVVISDVRMPGMTGQDFLEKIMGLDPKTLRILLTGEAQIGDDSEEIENEAVSLSLSKPCQPKTLLDMIHEGLKEKTYV